MNKTLLIGRLTKDIEVRQTGETSYGHMRIAVDRQYKREGQPEADYISLTMFGDRVTKLQQYLVKGVKLAVEGRIQTGSYEKDGKRVYTTDVIVENIEFVESRRAAAQQPAAENPEAAGLDESQLPFGG